MREKISKEGLGSESIESVKELMRKGHRCSEAIVMGFADQVGFEPEVAARISGGFGGYQAPGWTCGAVTGAVMIIGLKFGGGISANSYHRDLCFEMTQEFSNRFMARRDTIGCENLHSAIKRDPVLLNKVKTKKGKQRFCMNIALDAAIILQELLAEE